MPKRARRVVLMLLLVASTASWSLAKDRQWQVGTVVNFEEGDVNIQTGTFVTGNAEDGSFDAMAVQATSSQQKWTYLIDTGELLYVVSHKQKWGWSKAAQVTINGSVRYAIEGSKFYLIDEADKEHKLKIEQKTAKPPVAAAAPASAAKEAEPGGGEVRKGMSPEEVESVLGKPVRRVSFENTTRWTYRDLTVFFYDGVVVDLKF